MTDNELKNKLQAECRRPADDPFFTRKVMNRIPERQHSKARRVLAITYALAALVVVGWWIYMCGNFDMEKILSPTGWLSVMAMSAVSSVVFVKAAKYAM